ncbi:MAG: glutaminyl-peptide cyclotransferase [Candidatus Protochlamydia sp.]|nr:glutaminyl-peptide cyclotransferase [Candidatus Protochlamydia sp.]
MPSNSVYYSKKFFILFCFFNFSFLFSEIEVLIPSIIRKIPHASNAFTQGLAIDEDKNVLYESTGLYGRSSVRQIDLKDGKITRLLNLPSHLFGEGLALANNRLVQLTWKEKSALVYSKESFDLLKIFPYTGEGWGLCYDQELNRFWMSNGSSLLFRRDPVNFKIDGALNVHMDGRNIDYLNDLVCAGPVLFANRWGKDFIYRIDKQTGKVTGMIDASHLLTPAEKANLDPESVLNGIAYRESTGTFFLTGKYWPYIYEVLIK